jgi:teichuronic acid biosynthesis glycosyltransferase TuaG
VTVAQVSIIMPLYNAAPFISEAVRSVQAQTFSDWELLIVDDASHDGSAAIAAACAQDDARIRLVQHPQHAGAAAARNTAIAAAGGRYIAFLDSDDRWLPQKLATQLAFMQAHAAPFSCSAYAVIGADGQPTGRIRRAPSRITYRDLLRSNLIGCLTVIYDAQQLGKRTMPLLSHRQDYALWLQLLKQLPAVDCLPDVLAEYRVRQRSLSRAKAALLYHNWQLFRRSEGFGIVRSAYCLGWNIWHKLTE